MFKMETTPFKVVISACYRLEKGYTFTKAAVLHDEVAGSCAVGLNHQPTVHVGSIQNLEEVEDHASYE